MPEGPWCFLSHLLVTSSAGLLRHSCVVEQGLGWGSLCPGPQLRSHVSPLLARNVVAVVMLVIRQTCWGRVVQALGKQWRAGICLGVEDAPSLAPVTRSHASFAGHRWSWDHTLSHGEWQGPPCFTPATGVNFMQWPGRNWCRIQTYLIPDLSRNLLKGRKLEFFMK